MIGHAAAAAALLLTVILGAPALLIILGAVPHQLPTWTAVQTSLTTGDDNGQYFRIAAGGAAWICWALYTAATISEITATVRAHGHRMTRPRPTGVRLLAPAALVTAVAVLFTTAPTVVTPAAATPVPAVRDHTTPVSPVIAAPVRTSAMAAASPVLEPTAGAPGPKIRGPPLRHPVDHRRAPPTG